MNNNCSLYVKSVKGQSQETLAYLEQHSICEFFSSSLLLPLLSSFSASLEHTCNMQRESALTQISPQRSKLASSMGIPTRWRHLPALDNDHGVSSVHWHGRMSPTLSPIFPTGWIFHFDEMLLFLKRGRGGGERERVCVYVYVPYGSRRCIIGRAGAWCMAGGVVGFGMVWYGMAVMGYAEEKGEGGELHTKALGRRNVMGWTG